MVNVGNCNFLKVNCRFLLVIWVKQSVYSVIIFYSSTFYSLFLSFFVLEILTSSKTRFLSEVLLPFPNSYDLNSRVMPPIPNVDPRDPRAHATHVI